MLDRIVYPKSLEYRTGAENEPLAFYLNSLLNSNRLDLLLGYFSSSAINVLALGFAKFISNGGRMRMIVNHILSANDKNAVLQGTSSSDGDYNFTAEDFYALSKTLDEYGKHFFECIAWLISSKRIDLRVIRPKAGSGISHYKSGVFYDEHNKVKFKGSCNFTASGLLQNLEELDVKLSWKNESAAFTEYDEVYEALWNGTSDYAELIPFEQIEEAIVQTYGGKDLDELLVDEHRLASQKAKQTRSLSYKETLDGVIKEIEAYRLAPRFPYSAGPREYQREAYQNWLGNGCKGIFAMATGTGKTITSLNCVLEEYKKHRSYKTVIIVPTTVLVQQWEKEARKFNFRSVVKVSSKSKNWQSELKEVVTQLSYGVTASYVVIVTYKSFCKEQFQSLFKRLPAETVLIADEAHNIASPQVAALLPGVHLQKRIGLSATPKRVYDLEGSIEMEKFFADAEPYTYSFTMERAIAEGILCQYYYYPRLVNLTPSELEGYMLITKKLSRFYNGAEDNLIASQVVQQLLMKRKRIIHKAHGKLGTFKQILGKIIEQRGKLKYTLVYAPEGFYSDEEINEDAFPDLDEEDRIIDYYSSIVRQFSPETMTTQYTSDSDDKDYVLKQFEAGNIDMLLSMKCLDEGVDIPRTEQAIFCSSTGNPRQFIQRRGRILRQHPQKSFAYIYDMVVIPRTDPTSATFDLERNLARKELERVVHFSYMALNKASATEVFRDICEYYGLSLDTIHEELNN